MTVDLALENQMARMFDSLKTYPAGQLPSMGELSERLSAIAPGKGVASATYSLDIRMVQLLSTASINMWMRAVHSFLISASLTNTSPIWSSVTGYYSSHYSVRALAHSLGFFHLFRAKRNVQVSMKNGRFEARFFQKGANDREHVIYWSVVRSCTIFADDPIFTDNKSDQGPSDSQHRDAANYADHVPSLPKFAPLSKDELTGRIRHISEVELSSVRIPNVDAFPDLVAVQLIAYHRLVKFRDLLDELLGTSNRYWNQARSPTFAKRYMDYQVAESNTTGYR